MKIVLPDDLKKRLETRIANAEDAREQAVEVMYELQNHYGYLSDEAMDEAARLLHMTTLELEELATFYDHLYREPVGKYVIRVCDSVICWMYGQQSLRDYICSLLQVKVGETTSDGLFTVLPVCCIGYCDRAPAMSVNWRVFGRLNPEKIDRILEKLREQAKRGEKRG